MERKHRSITAVLVVGALLVGSVALAMPAYQKVFNSTYKISDNSAIGKAGCAVCHLSKTQTNKWNAYGEDIRKAMKAANTHILTRSILQKVESLDSDKDGFSNIAEIKADTLPGDPKSHPAK